MTKCPKCAAASGDDWSQCRGSCPMEGSPFFTVAWVDKYDNVLNPFKQLMERELHANSYKGDREAWLNLTRDGGMFEVYDHASKLAAALRVEDTAKIIEHAADVANAAMMILDSRGLLIK